MSVRVIEPPEPVVTYDEAKQHLRLDHDDEQAYVEALIAAATTWLDGPAGWLGRALGSQLLELRTEGFGCYLHRLALPYPPLIAVESVSYLDVDDVEQTVAADQYLADDRHVWFRPDFSAPPVSSRPEPVIVRYRAGYRKAVEGSDPVAYENACPAPVKVAILMLVGQWFSNREPVALGVSVAQLPFAVEALLSPYRVFR